MLNYKIILKITGLLSFILACLMLIPIVIEILCNDINIFAFIFSFFIILFFSGILFLSGYNSAKSSLSIRDCLLLFLSSWILIILMQTIPYCFAMPDVSYFDILLESASIFTRTGVILYMHYSSGFIIFKSLMQVFGVIFYLISLFFIVDKMGAGYLLSFSGQHFNILNSSVKKDVYLKTFLLIKIFGGLLCVFTILLMLFDVNFFNAITCISSCIATGYVDLTVLPVLSVEYDCCLIILSILLLIVGISSLNLMKVVNLKFDIFDLQTKVYFITFGIVVGIVFYFIQFSWSFDSIFSSFSHAVLYAISSVTTTGLSSFNYIEKYGTIDSLLLLLNFIGASTLSASGGIKIIRVILLVKIIKNAIIKIIKPEIVSIPTYQNKKIDHIEINNLLFYLLSFIMLFIIFVFFLRISGVDLNTSIHAIFYSMTNNAIDLSVFENITLLTATSKLILSIAMISGRLEFIFFFIMCSSSFWKK